MGRKARAARDDLLQVVPEDQRVFDSPWKHRDHVARLSHETIGTVADRGWSSALRVGSTGSREPIQVGLRVEAVARLNGRGGIGEALVTRVADVDDASLQ